MEERHEPVKYKMSQYLGQSVLAKGAGASSDKRYAVLHQCLVISVIEPTRSNHLLDTIHRYWMLRCVGHQAVPVKEESA